MIDITVRSLQKYFGAFQLLSDVDFEIETGEKVGLIGKNGAGKTTLMKMISDTAAGRPLRDPGEIILNPNARLGLVDQLPVFPADYTVEQVLRLAFGRIYAMEEELKRLEQGMGSDHSPSLLGRYGELRHRYEHAGGYDTEYELARVTMGLDIPAGMREQKFYSLSGGEQTRVDLARLILEKSDILLLDEPTNHLDIESVEWLSEYICAYRGTVLLISHDRWFLDQVCQRIVEIENGVSADYNGNYSYYVVEKQRRYEEALKLWQEQMGEKARLEAMARRYRAWATEQAIHKAKVIEHKIERMTISDRPRRERRMRAGFDEASFRADEALKFSGISKKYGDRVILNNVSGLIGGGERIAVYGPNGCGKTTLLDILTGDLEADAGYVRFGPQAKWAYLPQIVRFERMERSLLDTILYAVPVNVQQARDMLGAFKFSGEDVFKPLTTLSGGELSRLKLCILMYDDLNFLILDEPTNHLDLASREWLEDLLDGFGGVILFVSHDRYFVTRFATRVWEMTDGRINDYKCPFEEYRRRRKSTAPQVNLRAERPRKRPEGNSPAKEQRRLERQREALQREATELEYQIENLNRDIETHASDYQRLGPLLQEKSDAEARLLECYEQLEEIEAEL